MPSRSGTAKCSNRVLLVSDVYVYKSGNARVSVSGNPNLSNVKVIMSE